MLVDDWGFEGSGRVLWDILFLILGLGGEGREYGCFIDGRGVGGWGLFEWVWSGDVGVWEILFLIVE